MPGKRGTQKQPPEEPSTLTIGQFSFKNCQKIAEGTYGEVYKACDDKTETEMAIKTVIIDSEEGIPGTCLREVSILKELNHTNIVRLRDAVCDDDFEKLYIIFEYVEYDLKMLLDKIRPRLLPMNHVKSFLWQLLRALSFCHARRVMHRNLKPQNVLIKADGTVKLAGFRLARPFTIPSRCFTHRKVTLSYHAPEILLRARFYSTTVDIWSLACIFAELVTMEPLFAGETEAKVLREIFETLGTPDPLAWPGLSECIDYQNQFPINKECTLSKRVRYLHRDGLDLLTQMLLCPPEERITANAALSHRFLRDVPADLEPITKLLERRSHSRSLSLD